MRALPLLALLPLIGCGSGSTPTAPAPPRSKAPALASAPARPGEIVVRSEASPKTAGPFSFAGSYRVRFVQYSPEDPGTDFSGQTTFVADLEREQGVPARRLFRAAAAGGARTMRLNGRFYVDVSFGDYPFAIRFSPERG